jgi:8-oxo-dGTP pyrophosphatase MutT (NUDIX family)
MTVHPLFAELRATLAARRPRSLGELPDGTKRASVLVPFFQAGGAPHLLFLKRPEGQYRHAGQIAFPGGKRDGEESAVDCALREAMEEVGLSPSDVEVLGELDEFDTVVTGFRINPIVGVIPHPYAFKPDPFEVERLITVPVSRLLDRTIFRQELRRALGRLLPVYYYTVDGDVIWGVTGGMLAPLLELVRTLPSCPGA